MLWTRFKADIVGHARSLCWQTCASPVLWDVFKAHVEERVGTTVVGRVQGSCGGSCPGHVLWNVFETYVVGRVGDCVVERFRALTSLIS